MGKVIHLKRDRSFLKRRLKTCLYMSVSQWPSTHVAVRGQLAEVSSLLLLHGSRGSNLDHQASTFTHLPKIFFRFICIILKCVYVCGGEGVCAYSSNYPQKPEVSDVPGVGVIGICELPDMGTWNPSQALWKNSMCS